LLVAPQRSTDINQNLEDYRGETGATVSTNTLLNEFSGAPDLVVERVMKVRAFLARWDFMIPEPGGNHSDDKRPVVMQDTGKKSDAGGISGSRRSRDGCMQPVDLRFVQAVTGKNNRVLTIAFTKDRPNGFRQRAVSPRSSRTPCSLIPSAPRKSCWVSVTPNPSRKTRHCSGPAAMRKFRPSGSLRTKNSKTADMAITASG